MKDTHHLVSLKSFQAALPRTVKLKPGFQTEHIRTLWSFSRTRGYLAHTLFCFIHSCIFQAFLHNHNVDGHSHKCVSTPLSHPPSLQYLPMPSQETLLFPKLFDQVISSYHTFKYIQYFSICYSSDSYF